MYLLIRGFEAALLAVGAVLVLTLVPLADEFTASGDQSLAPLARVTQEASLHAYWVAMIGLSLGSLLFCRSLFRARLVPRPIAACGLGGYALLATGGVLELLVTASASCCPRQAGCSRRRSACSCWSRASRRRRVRTPLLPPSLCSPSACARPHGCDRRAGPPGEPDRGRRDPRAVRPRRLLARGPAARPSALPVAGQRAQNLAGQRAADRLEPDLSWWSKSGCQFVGDCKYKRPAGSIPNADVYQMLAYLTALRLDDGLLVCARDEGLPADVTVEAVDKRVHVRDVDVAQPQALVLAQAAAIARLIERLAARREGIRADSLR